MELDRLWAIEKVLLQLDGMPRYIEGMTRKSPVYVSEKIGEDIPTFTLFGSRGCPKYCKYCTATRRTGAKIRHIGAYQMFSYFLIGRHKYKASVFCNQADTFAIHQNDIDFFKMVREYRIFSNDNQFVINNPNAFFLEQFFIKEKNFEINIELINLLKDAGFNTITIAIETLSQRFNNKINWKRIKPEMVYELCQTIRAMGFKIDIYIMYGFPEQTLEEFNTDLKFAEKLLQYVDLITWNSFSLLPGTIYYDNYIEKKGREKEFRQMILKGYGCYYPDESFNLSNVSLKYYHDSLAPFGQSWI
jgi:radical SAM superfamily enzyme YgiQ (UPF0313 family)